MGPDVHGDCRPGWILGCVMMLLVAVAAPASAAALGAVQLPPGTNPAPDSTVSKRKFRAERSSKTALHFLMAPSIAFLPFKTAVGAVMLHLWKVGHPGNSNTCRPRINQRP